MIEKKLELTLLFDFYGELLTEKQEEVMSLYLIDDYGFVEIGENLSISRQAVYDKIKKSTKMLYDYEDRLGLVKRYNERQLKLMNVVSKLESLRAYQQTDGLNDIIEEVQAILSL